MPEGSEWQNRGSNCLRSWPGLLCGGVVIGVGEAGGKEAALRPSRTCLARCQIPIGTRAGGPLFVVALYCPGSQCRIFKARVPCGIANTSRFEVRWSMSRSRPCNAHVSPTRVLQFEGAIKLGHELDNLDARSASRCVGVACFYLHVTAGHNRAASSSPASCHIGHS